MTKVVLSCSLPEKTKVKVFLSRIKTCKRVAISPTVLIPLVKINQEGGMRYENPACITIRTLFYIALLSRWDTHKLFLCCHSNFKTQKQTEHTSMHQEETCSLYVKKSAS